MAVCIVCGNPVVNPAPLPSGEFCHWKCLAQVKVQINKRKNGTAAPDSSRDLTASRTPPDRSR